MDVFQFNYDACASEENHLCVEYGTEARSCLDADWVNVTWLNPPYSNPGPFLQKAWRETYAGVTTVALVKGDPSTKWWVAHVRDKAMIHWIPNRIKFYLNCKPTEHTASFPSALLIYWGITWRPDALEIT